MKYPIARFFIFTFSVVLFSCKKNNNNSETIIANASNNLSTNYSVKGNKIYYSNATIQLIGVNAMHIFSAGSSDMNSWKLDIAREFVGNVNQEPLSGGVIKDANGSWLYPLQTIVDSNTANHRISIICPFGWDGTSATVFSGARPSLTSWWSAYKIKLQQWAVQFKNQPNVWLELWNEPYNWNGTDGFTDAIWLSDMNSLVSIIRNAGNNNIVLVPCAQQGQDESILNRQGQNFLVGKSNILFDIHAYEKWLLTGNANMGSRLQQLKQNNLPVFFGEVGPMNAGTLMDPKPFLDSVYNRGLSVSAWLWKYDGNDQDALLNTTGGLNNNNNNNWGNIYNNLSLGIRKP